MSEISKCIICLESDNSSDLNIDNPNKILQIPCECKIYCHEDCFDKINSNICFICKQPYEMENYSGDNYLKLNVRENQKLMTFEEIIIENYEDEEILRRENKKNCWYHINQCFKIIAFACMPALSILIGSLIVWINGMVSNMIFCLFFSFIIDNCFLKYDDIGVFMIGVSSLIFWLIVYKFLTSKFVTNCCKKNTSNN